jgi:hypothetical protein
MFKPFLYDVELCFPKETVLTFDYDETWLEEKIKSIAGKAWNFIEPKFLPPYKKSAQDE